MPPTRPKKKSTPRALTSLSLGNNKLGAQGAKAIADSLHVNGALTELSLADNEISDQGAAVIGDALRVNGALTSLDPRINTIDRAAKRALNEANAKRTTPVRLDL